MKKIKNILMSALLSLFSLQGLYAEEGAKVVVIKPACLAETTTPNRAPVRVPITAYYDSFTSSIIVSFIYDIGDVDVNVTNTSTGDFLEGTINAYGAPAIISISSATGYYNIHFVLSSGAEYYGEFELE